MYDFDADPHDLLSLVYGDWPLTHVDAEGRSLPSTNSQPSYILRLVHLLGVEAGHNVLEVGSGSGWLAAVMARLAAGGAEAEGSKPRGHVTGVEIIAPLAEQSRADLAAVGVDNVTVVIDDAAAMTEETCFPGAPFDRVIMTAAIWEPPAWLFHAVKDGGKLLLPVALRGGGGCQVTLFRRDGARFVGECSIHGYFVPFVDARNPGGAAGAPPPLWKKIKDAAVSTYPFSLGATGPTSFWGEALGCRNFLRLAEPGFTTFGGDIAVGRAHSGAHSFGLIDEASRSAAVCRMGELVCYGSEAAGRRLARAHEQWTQMGSPGMNSFDFTIAPSEGAPRQGEGVFIERRGGVALIWRLKPEAIAWRGLLDAVEP